MEPPPDLLLLTDEPLDEKALLAFVAQPPSVGAAVSFLGLTRSPGLHGKAVTHLAFEAYAPMARRALAAIALEARARLGATRGAIAHRLGSVPLNEASLCVCASSPHRAEALAALGFVVEAVKARVAVWKQEVYADGSRAWMANCAAGEGGAHAGH